MSRSARTGRRNADDARCDTVPRAIQLAGAGGDLGANVGGASLTDVGEFERAEAMAQEALTLSESAEHSYSILFGLSTLGLGVAAAR